MARKQTGLEGPAELARRMNRWPALRDEPGDEKAYQFAQAVLLLHDEVGSKTTELDEGLDRLAPLFREIEETKGGGGLFDEARGLARSLELLRSR